MAENINFFFLKRSNKKSRYKLIQSSKIRHQGPKNKSSSSKIRYSLNPKKLCSQHHSKSRRNAFLCHQWFYKEP